MKDSELRKALLNGRKTERINFAVTPKLKAAASKLAEERCATVSSLIVNLLVEESLRNKDVTEEVAQICDASMADDAAANFEDFFKACSPDVIRRVI